MSTRAVAERAAMLRALELARTPGVPLGPNPRVGCVLLSTDLTVLAEGFHRGAGTPHAEVDALRRAGQSARGATAVVTLEPCDHTGRTGPCTQALIDAGVRRVVYALADPNPVAAGGAATLLASGVEVEAGLEEAAAREVNRAWAFGVRHRRPLVTWKFATTLDGRSAAADGTSRWVSNPTSRRDAQRLRSECDAILVGTQTVYDDDPALTRRDERDLALPRDLQPLRVVMGERDVPRGSRVLDDAAPSAFLRTHDPAEVLSTLFERGCRHLLLEGGPTVAAAFLVAGLVDEVVAYVAPLLLGAGRNAVGDLGIRAMTDAFRLELAGVSVLDGDVRLTLTPRGVPTKEQG